MQSFILTFNPMPISEHKLLYESVVLQITHAAGVAYYQTYSEVMDGTRVTQLKISLAIFSIRN